MEREDRQAELRIVLFDSRQNMVFNRFSKMTDHSKGFENTRNCSFFVKVYQSVLHFEWNLKDTFCSITHLEILVCGLYV